MKDFKIFILVTLIITALLSGCQKSEIAPDNYFETEINSLEKNFTPVDATINRGITIIKAEEKESTTIKTIIITVNAEDIGNYKQTFDYKTGVSISQCGLTYMTLTKEEITNPSFFMSFEGNVNITELDRKNKYISGNYFFKLNSVPDIAQPYILRGKFIKLSYK